MIIHKSIQCLSDHEREIFLLLIKNKTNKEIAKEIKRTVKTVKYYLTSIYKKLGVKSRYGALFFAIKNGLLTAKNIQLT